MAKATLHKYFVNCFIVVYLSVCLYICVSSLVFLGYDLPKIFVLEVYVDSLCEYERSKSDTVNH